MADYLVAADITDEITTGFTTKIAAIIVRSTLECNNLAREFDVDDTDIETPLDYAVKEWLISWVMKTFCEELTGKTGLDITSEERYFFKWKMYSTKEKDLRAKVTAEMFIDEVEDIGDAGYQTGILYRS
jgi:hypothetical protein